MNLLDLSRIRSGKTARSSSFDPTGRNNDFVTIPAGRSRVLADIKGPGVITHLWLTQPNHYRECLIRITWDSARHPSVLCPLGDFFGLGHGIVNSYQSLLFTASTNSNNQFNTGCALNCYAPMPFGKRALVELVNESGEEHLQYFYVDYERVPAGEIKGLGYFHAEFRRACPFSGWGPQILVNTPRANASNKERVAWQNNYVILQTAGRGHYLGCNLSVTNLQGTWWGEGDDMIWVDGYKWPPDLHGTGSEDYLNQAWGMQPNAFLRNGSSIHESNTGGYQTSYVHHLDNPVRFTREIKVTIEHGHANHVGNEMSSVAYWYARKPARIADPPPVAKRMPVKKVDGRWVIDDATRYPGPAVVVTGEMRRLKGQWAEDQEVVRRQSLSDRHSPFVVKWKLSRLLPARDIRKTGPVRLTDDLGWRSIGHDASREPWFINIHAATEGRDGLAYAGNRFRVDAPGTWTLHLGHDGPARLFVDGKAVLTQAKRINPAPRSRSSASVTLSKGEHEILVALDTDGGHGWGFYFCFEAPEDARRRTGKPRFPAAKG